MLTERLQSHARLAAARIVRGVERFGCDLFLGGAGMAGSDPWSVETSPSSVRYAALNGHSIPVI
jgi:hypothetical protein